MMRFEIVALAPIGLLAACAGDNPDNVPLYGEWEMVTRVDSLSIDGILIPPEDFPSEFKQLDGTEKMCGEPMFINRQWQEWDINRKVAGECTLDEFDATPRLVTGKGQCEGDGSAADFKPEMNFRINQAPERYKLFVSLEGSANIPGVEGRHVVRATAVQQGTRLGDC